MDIAAIAPKYADYLKEHRQHFHAHPEVSGQEHETSAYIKAELDRLGVQWRSCGMQTGILATIDGTHPGKTVLLRADMDALTVSEETGLSFASQKPGLMHACGHDTHMAMLMTALRIINDLRSQFAGRVVFAFQPAEEIGQGADSMIADGALDGVDAVFGMHVWPEVKSGTVSLAAGPRMASADRFTIDIEGKGGHGATPHLCVDVATCTAAIVQSLQTIVSREIDPKQTAVVTVGMVNLGTRFNVTPGSAHIEGTTRAFSAEVRNGFEEEITRIATSVAAAYRAKATVNYHYICAPTINDPEIARLAQGSARKILGEDGLSDYGITMGAEDFSSYLMKKPGAFALLGVASDDPASHGPLHSGHFVPDENCLLGGAMLSAQFAMDFLAQ